MSKEKLEFRATQWAELKPNVYAGSNCDQIEHRWDAHTDGDKGDGATFATLELHANTFPPGTRITIEEPCCPECGDTRSVAFPRPDDGPIYRGPCECGFDWDTWTREEYS